MKAVNSVNQQQAAKPARPKLGLRFGQGQPRPAGEGANK